MVVLGIGLFVFAEGVIITGGTFGKANWLCAIFGLVIAVGGDMIATGIRQLVYEHADVLSDNIEELLHERDVQLGNIVEVPNEVDQPTDDETSVEPLD